MEKANSSYFQVFKEMFRDVVACKCDVTRELDTRLASATCQTSCQYVVVGFAALTEAQDINMYLKPLRNHFDDYEQIDFDSSEFRSARWFPTDQVPLDRSDPEMSRFLEKLARRR